MKTYYEILGVPPDVDAGTLKTAFKKLAFRHHPDRNPHDPEAENRIKQLNEAYATLSDPAKRHLYDQQLHRRPIPETENTRPHTHYGNPRRYDTFHAYRNRNQNRPRTIRKENIPLSYRIRAYGITAICLLLCWIGLSAFSKYVVRQKAAEKLTESRQLRQSGNVELAFYKLNESLNFDKTFAEAYFERGLLELDYWKDYPFAEANFTAAIRFSTHPAPDLYDKRAISRIRVGRFAEAEADFDTARKMRKGL